MKYVRSLKKSIVNRFPTLPLISSFSIFDPTQIPDREQPGFSEYGSAAIQRLADQYLDKEGDKKQLVDEWGVFKYILVRWKTELPPEVKKPPSGFGSNSVVSPTD